MAFVCLLFVYVVAPSVIGALGLSDLKLYNADNPVPCVFNGSNTFKPDRCNEPLIVVLSFKFVIPRTFNNDNNDVLLFKIVNPLTLSDDNNVVLLFKIVNPLALRDDNNALL